MSTHLQLPFPAPARDILPPAPTVRPTAQEGAQHGQTVRERAATRGRSLKSRTRRNEHGVASAPHLTRTGAKPSPASAQGRRGWVRRAGWESAGACGDLPRRVRRLPAELAFKLLEAFPSRAAPGPARRSRAVRGGLGSSWQPSTDGWPGLWAVAGSAPGSPRPVAMAAALGTRGTTRRLLAALRGRTLGLAATVSAEGPRGGRRARLRSTG